jgi:hypothetical protein
MGTGMAFPPGLLRPEMLATGHVTEDLLIGVRLAMSGSPPQFCPQAVVISDFAPSEAGRMTQKTRWMQGQLATLLQQGAPLLLEAARRKDRALLGMALDLMVPPLGLLVAANGVLVVLAAAWLLATGAIVPFVVALLGILLVFSSLIIAWAWVGRDLITTRELISAPVYLAKNLAVIAGFALGRRVGWVRAERVK